jgi:hypothetical protein
MWVSFVEGRTRGRNALKQSVEEVGRLEYYIRRNLTACTDNLVLVGQWNIGDYGGVDM